jgi:hypothetical protein
MGTLGDISNPEQSNGKQTVHLQTFEEMKRHISH